MQGHQSPNCGVCNANDLGGGIVREQVHWNVLHCNLESPWGRRGLHVGTSMTQHVGGSTRPPPWNVNSAVHQVGATNHPGNLAPAAGNGAPCNGEPCISNGDATVLPGSAGGFQLLYDLQKQVDVKPFINQLDAVDQA